MKNFGLLILPALLLGAAIGMLATAPQARADFYVPVSISATFADGVVATASFDLDLSVPNPIDVNIQIPFQLRSALFSLR